MTKIKIDVILSSYNGERTLPKFLNAMEKLEATEFEWQLIVVNNNSSDNTSNVLNEYKGRLPLIIMYESRRGKNYALNSAVDRADGELLVFTDDDVIPEKNWLKKLADCADNHKNHSVFGGVIVPRWPSHPADWICSYVPLGIVYAVTDKNWHEGEITQTNGAAWGPNMMIRRQIFVNGYRFSTAIGPDGTKTYMMGSESELVKRLYNDGYKGWFCAEARVEHLVRVAQMEKSWVMQRYFRYGRASYCLDRKAKKIFGVERWLFRRFFECILEILSPVTRMNEEKLFKALENYHRTRGMIRQAFEINRSNRPSKHL